MPVTVKNLVGNRYGRGIVTRFIGIYGRRRSIWELKCDCGNIYKTSRDCLVKGHTKSCGCIKHERMIGGIFKLGRGESSARTLYSSYIVSAKKRGLLFDITLDEFKVLTKQNCYYCGQKPSRVCDRKSRFGEYIYNGIDRIDSSKGYTKDNIRPCCKQCNYAKNTAPDKEFVEWIKRVYSHLVIEAL